MVRLDWGFIVEVLRKKMSLLFLSWIGISLSFPNLRAMEPDLDTHNYYDEIVSKYIGKIDGQISYGDHVIEKNTSWITNEESVIREHVGCIIKGNLFARKYEYLPQMELEKLFVGTGSTYGFFYCEGIKLEGVTAGSGGKILFARVVRGKVEQDGKIYGPGTVFKDGHPDRISI